MNIWLELLKLAAQLVGAIVVAKLAVQWALERFKSEKSWERQLSALTDVIAALGAMTRVAKSWMSDYYDESRPTKEREEEQMKLYRGGELLLQSVAATARLILPSKLADHISQTENKLKSIGDNPNYEEWLIMELEILEERTDELIVMGRSIFDADAVRPPDPLLHPWLFLAYRNKARLSFSDR
jgi:hypothetical protein